MNDISGDGEDEPSREGHVTCEAFERLDICVCRFVVSIGRLIDGVDKSKTNELGCDVRDVRPL
jgi:hypothetical protein